MDSSFWALLPPIVAIGLALLTKEVYTSLFIGIAAGALLFTGFSGAAAGNSFWTSLNPVKALETIFQIMNDKIGGNTYVLLFLVFLGMIVALMNMAGGSAAYGRFASSKLKSKRGALLSTTALGALIFVDDYFNCLTVGSVMRPVTDKFGVSRAKLAYIIDSTAAPICIIAPISSWAAAVASSLPENSGIDGFQLFISTIPYNLYALLSIAMLFYLAITRFDFGSMRTHELNAEKGDLFTTSERPYGEGTEEEVKNGKVIDLVLPVVALILLCILGMLYTGGLFEGNDIITAFSECNAALGLALGSFAALIFMLILYVPRKVLSFKRFSSSVISGFTAMVPAIAILVLAWTLAGITGADYLNANAFMASIVDGSSATSIVLPAILFLLSIGTAFATGTSWGTFGIFVPIVVAIFPAGGEMLTICVAAVLAGAVCGDHTSPISDTTIMASTGAQCDHINHVSTQIPYAFTVAGVCLVGYIIGGFVKNAWITLGISLFLLFAVLTFIRKFVEKKQAA